jgi:hypothetical protein
VPQKGLLWPIANEQKNFDAARQRAKMGNHAERMRCGRVTDSVQATPTRSGASWSAAIGSGPPRRRLAYALPMRGPTDRVAAYVTGLMNQDTAVPFPRVLIAGYGSTSGTTGY